MTERRFRWMDWVPVLFTSLLVISQIIVGVLFLSEVLQIQILALDNVLMGIEDMTRTTAQQAINAMLDVVKNVAGGALKALV